MSDRLLIITEKDMAARKIADILGGPVEITRHGSGRQKVSSYSFQWNGRDAVAIGLRGHVMRTAFPERYKRWSLKNLREIIRDPDFVWVVDGGAQTVTGALRAAAKGASEVIIATDFDREGELIGNEALAILAGDALKRHPHDDGAARKKRGAEEVEPPAPDDDGTPHVRAMLPRAVVDRHHRVRYSALIAEDVQAAFAKPTTLDFGLAEAARARQDIDLLWGAVLSRFISLASYRYGASYLSVGRVQTPTLRLIVDRERERRAFVPVPYWEVWADLEREGALLSAGHVHGRFDSLEAAQSAHSGADEPQATVVLYETRPRAVKPPTPFNTTSLMSAASSVGVSPSRAMRAAESLYLDGLISYPRTDNTVYPKSLDLNAVAATMTGYAPVAEAARMVAARERLTATRGNKRTSDHPPIYPVGVPRGHLEGDEAKVYDLVARRFLATVMDPAEIESQKLEVSIGSERFVARGSRVARPGFLLVYDKYSTDRDKPLPQVEAGDTFVVEGIRLESKQTQPPGRYSQGTLIEKMEDLGLGTKATRADIIQRLYDRTYVRGNPVEATDLGMALIDAFDAALEGAPVDVSSPEMTARLEADMDRISEGALGWEEVRTESQEMLEQAWKRLDEGIEGVRTAILEAVKRDQTLGTCHACGGEIAAVVSKKSGKRFAACRGVPDAAAATNPGESGGAEATAEAHRHETPLPSTLAGVQEAAAADDQGSPVEDGEGRPQRRGCGQTFPLPPFGQIVGAGKACPECGWPLIRVVGGRGSREQCIDYYGCPSNEAARARRAARASGGGRPAGGASRGRKRSRA
jgi:DNA topoisomerase I